MSFKRIPGPVFTWVSDGTTDPDYGIGEGARPGNDLPWAPVRPGHKPPGIPILPPSVDNGLPPDRPPHIWGGGDWVILDPGPDLPPIFGIDPVDPGFGIEAPPPRIDNTLPTPPPPATTKPPVGTWPPKPGGGTWVPTDPNFGKPVCPGIKIKWIWVPFPPDLSKPFPPAAQPK